MATLVDPGKTGSAKSTKGKGKGKATSRTPFTPDKGKDYLTRVKDGREFHRYKSGRTVEIHHDPYAAQAEAAAKLQYGGAQSELATERASNLRHDPEIDKVFDAFKAQLAGQRVTQVQQNDAGIQSVQDTGANIAASAEKAGVASAANSSPSGEMTPYQAELAKMSGAATAGLINRSGIQEDFAKAQAKTALTSLDTLGGAMEGQRLVEHGKTQEREHEYGNALADLLKERGAFKVKTRGELAQQDTENELAVQTLLAGNTKSLRDYRARIAAIKSGADVAAAHDASAEGIAAAGNVQSGINAQTGATATTTAAKTSAHATITAAKLRAANKDTGLVQPLGKGTDGKYRYRTSNGEVTLTEAQHQSWIKTRAKTIGAFRAGRHLLQQNADESKTAHRIARDHHLPLSVVQALLPAMRGGKVNNQQYQVLSSYFPGGIVPPGYITGQVN